MQRCFDARAALWAGQQHHAIVGQCIERGGQTGVNRSGVGVGCFRQLALGAGSLRGDQMMQRRRCGAVPTSFTAVGGLSVCSDGDQPVAADGGQRFAD